MIPPRFFFLPFNLLEDAFYWAESVLQRETDSSKDTCVLRETAVSRDRDPITVDKKRNLSAFLDSAKDEANRAGVILVGHVSVLHVAGTTPAMC